MDNNKNSLTSKAICSIIKECARAGVSHIKLSDIEITFGANTLVDGSQLTFPGMDTTLPQSGMIENLTPETTELSDEDKEEIRLATQAQMAIDDPTMFEDYLVDELIYGEAKNENERTRLK